MYSSDYNTSILFIITFTSSMGSMCWGYYLTVFNSLRIHLQTDIFPDASIQEIGLVASVISIGAAAGSLLSGRRVGTLGRKKTLVTSDFLAILGTCLCMVHSLPIIITGRTIIGIVIGLNSSIVPLYNVELAPLKLKGTMSALSMIMLSLGILLGFVAGLWVPGEGKGESNIWRIIFGLPLLVNVARIAIFETILNFETPLYLVMNNRIDEAKAVLSKIYNDNIGQHLQKVIKDKEALASASGTLTLRDLITPKYRKGFLICILVGTGRQLCGFSPIFMFFSVLAKESANNDPEVLALFSVFMGIVSFLATFVTAVIVEKTGRRPLITYGMLLMFITEGLYIFLGWIRGPDHPLLKYLLVVWPIFFRLSVGTLAFVYASEVLPSVGVAFVTFSQWVVSFIAIQTFLPSVEVLRIEGLLLPYAVFCLVSTVLYEKYLIETKGRTKAELIGLYNGQIKENEHSKELEMHKVPLISK